MKNFLTFLIIFCLLASSAFAAFVERMSCTGELPNGSKLGIVLQQKDSVASTAGVAVEVELITVEGTMGNIKTREDFSVSRQDNEALFEQVNKGLDFWLIDTKKGSSIKLQQAEKKKSYAFEMKNPREGIKKITVDFAGTSLMGGKFKNVLSSAQVYVHRTPAAHPEYLGSFPLSCSSN